MPIKDVNLAVGLYSINTDRGAEGRWKDGDHVRWWQGLPQKIGGWTRIVSNQLFTGLARNVVDWQSLAFKKIIGLGTHVKLYVWEGGIFTDITPIRTSGTLGLNPISTTSGLPIVGIAHTAHGAFDGDYVNFSGATAVGGITVSGTYPITEVLTANTYTITHATNASSTATGGGAAVAYQYEINIGGENAVPGLGFGVGPYGGGTYGTPRTVTSFLFGLRTWSLDNWGEDLIANPTNLGIYIWDTSAGNRATRITQAPATAKAIYVSRENRHIVALGAHDGTNDNPMLVRWCSAEDYTDWTPSLSNTAGDKLLDEGNELLRAVKTKGETLIFSDSAVISMTFDGPPFTFGFQPKGANGGIAGANAAKEFNSRVYWMADHAFKVYDGSVRDLDCEVLNHVFDDINWVQRSKVYAGANHKFAEVWWLYPSADSTECDRYVIFNTEGHWTYGTLARTVIIGDSDTFQAPYGAGVDGFLYNHEVGVDDDTIALPSHLVSGGIDLGEGEPLLHIGKYIPDFKTLTGSIELTLTGKKYPQDPDNKEISISGPHAITPSTQYLNPRIRTRQVSVAFQTNAIGDNWRMGKPRIDVKPHGNR